MKYSVLQKIQCKKNKIFFTVKQLYKKIFFLLLRKYLDFFHFILKKIHFKKYFSHELKPAQNILLCNCASLDNVFISTFIIPVLKKAYPHCKIGMMVSKGSSTFAMECPYIDWIHECTHWLHKINPRRKKILYFCAFHLFYKRVVARSLRKKRYDYALNLSPNFSDIAGVCFKAKIPVRIGYDIAGYKYLLSHLVPWKTDRYLPYNYLALLKAMGIEDNHLINFQSPYLSSVMLKVQRKIIKELPQEFILFHTNYTDSGGEVSKNFWMELKRLFEAKNRFVFFIGNGIEQKEWIAEITQNENQNLCNELSYLELFQAIHKATLIISVNSLFVHVAAALKRPCIALYDSAAHLDLSRPEFSQCVTFVKKDETLQKRAFRNDGFLLWVDTFCPKEVFQSEELILSSSTEMLSL